MRSSSSLRSTRVCQVSREDPDRKIIDEAASVVRRGGLVAFPTETVYGLGASALDAAAVAAIFEAKGRPGGDPVIVHVGSREEVTRVARDPSAQALSLAARFWPGPLTLILPKRLEVPPEVTGGLDTVGVRVPAHPVALALIRASAVPIAAPSANRFSGPSPTRASHVIADLDGRIDFVLDAGPTDIGIESTVLDLTGPRPTVRRPGGVTVEQLMTVLPDLVVVERYMGRDEVQVSPGQLLRHYAPRAEVTLYQGPPHRVVAKLAADARAKAAAGVRVGVLAPEDDLMALAPLVAAQAAGGRIVSRAYGSRRETDRAARELFDALRDLDAQGVDEILASAPEPVHLGRAVRDRLTRAAEGRVISA
jgi:L-threonylcarbamoyladenylate synthase